MRGLAAAAGAGGERGRTQPPPRRGAVSAPPRRHAAPAGGSAHPPPTQPVAVQPTQVVPQQPTAQQPTTQRPAPPAADPATADPAAAGRPQQPQQPTYQQSYQPPPTYQTRPPTQPTQPPPGPTAPRYAGGATGKKPRWGLIITVILAVVAVVFGGLYWYGRSLPEKVDPTNNNGGQASTLTGPKISAVHLSTGLTINGDASDWPSDIPTFDSNVLIAGNDTGLLGHWGLAWDDTNLYFIVKVTDQTALQTHTVGHVPAVQGRRGELRVRDRPAEEQQRLARDRRQARPPRTGELQGRLRDQRDQRAERFGLHPRDEHHPRTARGDREGRRRVPHRGGHPVDDARRRRASRAATSTA